MFGSVPVRGEPGYYGKQPPASSFFLREPGLGQALGVQGRDGEADEVRRRLDEAWVMADVLLRASRF